RPARVDSKPRRADNFAAMRPASRKSGEDLPAGAAHATRAPMPDPVPLPAGDRGAEAQGRARNPWAWIPTLYLAEGLPYVVAISWLLAVNSATHDIAADGFYILAQTEKQQALFVGVRSLSYRIATIAGQGLLVVLAGTLETRTGNMPLAWSITLGILAGLFL